MIFFHTINATYVYTLHLHYANTGLGDDSEIDFIDINVLINHNNMHINCFSTIQSGKPHRVLSTVMSSQTLIHMKVTSTHSN